MLQLTGFTCNWQVGVGFRKPVSGGVRTVGCSDRPSCSGELMAGTSGRDSDTAQLLDGAAVSLSSLSLAELRPLADESVNLTDKIPFQKLQ